MGLQGLIRLASAAAVGFRGFWGSLRSITRPERVPFEVRACLNR